MTTMSPETQTDASERREMKTREFTGQSIKDAERAAKEALGANLLGTDTVRDMNEAISTAQAKTGEDALQEAERRINELGFDRQLASVIQEGQSGVSKVEEYEEREARKLWRKTAPRGAQIDGIECTIPSKNGLMGMGKRPGTWTVEWSAPFIAEARYKMPAVVKAMFWG